MESKWGEYGLYRHNGADSPYTIGESNFDTVKSYSHSEHNLSREIVDSINSIGAAISDTFDNIKEKIEAKSKQHKDEIWTVYTLKDPITSEVRYVGRTQNLNARLSAHKTPGKD